MARSIRLTFLLSAMGLSLAGCGAAGSSRGPVTYVVRSEDQAEYAQLMQTVTAAGGGESPFGRAWLIERQPCELGQRWENAGKTDEQYANLAEVDPANISQGPESLLIPCERDSAGAPTKCFHLRQVSPAGGGEELQDSYGIRFKPEGMAQVVPALARLRTICLAARQ